MQLITEITEKNFNPEAVRRGDFIRARYESWDEPKNGLVEEVSAEQIRVLYQPELSNVTNFFPIHLSEAAAGKWEISWSRDLCESWTAESGEVSL